jgi:hypothetical protein
MNPRMTCLHCGKSIPLQGNVCCYCGHPIQQSRNVFWKRTGIVFVCGLIGLVGGPIGYLVGVVIGIFVAMAIVRG